MPDFLPKDGENYNFSPDYSLANQVAERSWMLYQGADTTMVFSGFIPGRKYFLQLIPGTGPAGSTTYDLASRSSVSFVIPASQYQDSVQIHPSDDTMFCQTDTVVFKAARGTVYKWYNGVKNDSLSVNERKSVFFLSKAPDGCIVSSDTVLAKAIMMPVLTKPIVWSSPPYCEGDTVEITVRSNLINGYRWSTGDTLPTIKVTQSGTYSVASVNRMCEMRDSISITFQPYPIFNFAADTLSFLFDEEASIDFTTSARKYQWTFLDENGNRKPIKFNAATSGYLKLSGSLDSGCVSSDSIFIRIYRPDSLFIPNAFSPDGDGLNDVWQITSFYGGEYSVQVFDRWGALLYSSAEEQPAWNGMKNGEVLPTGPYYFVIKPKSKDVVSGTLLLIR